MMRLHQFFRSGTSHRTRIALNLKGLAYTSVPVHLGKGEHAAPAFKAINPQGLVPALVLDDGQVLTQSPAIIEWLEERYPNPALLPVEPEARARVRAMAALVGCDIHPVNNKRILDALRSRFGADDAIVNDWCGTWINAGFEALEALLRTDAHRGAFCFGNRPGLAEVYLIPQVESSRRFKVDLAPFPLIRAIDEACSQLEAFQRAVPSAQTDAV